MRSFILVPGATRFSNAVSGLTFAKWVPRCCGVPVPVPDGIDNAEITEVLEWPLPLAELRDDRVSLRDAVCGVSVSERGTGSRW